jgi:hypothetical protein
MPAPGGEKNSTYHRPNTWPSVTIRPRAFVKSLSPQSLLYSPIRTHSNGATGCPYVPSPHQPWPPSMGVALNTWPMQFNDSSLKLIAYLRGCQSRPPHCVRHGHADPFLIRLQTYSRRSAWAGQGCWGCLGFHRPGPTLGGAQMDWLAARIGLSWGAVKWHNGRGCTGTTSQERPR